MANLRTPGVKDYAQTYWEPDYEPKDTDLLACFKITPPGGPLPPRGGGGGRGRRELDGHVDHGYGPTC